MELMWGLMVVLFVLMAVHWGYQFGKAAGMEKRDKDLDKVVQAVYHYHQFSGRIDSRHERVIHQKACERQNELIAEINRIKREGLTDAAVANSAARIIEKVKEAARQDPFWKEESQQGPPTRVTTEEEAREAWAGLTRGGILQDSEPPPGDPTEWMERAARFQEESLRGKQQQALLNECCSKP